jgi:transposase
MAGKTIIMSILKQVLLLRKGDVTLQGIANAVKISRNTVKKYLRLIEAKQLSIDELLQMEDTALEAFVHEPDPQEKERYESLAAMFPHFGRELGRTGVNRWLLWGEYKQRYPDGYNYSRFCDHFRQWKQSQSGTMHIEHEPGDKVFIDYTGKKLSIVDPISGQPRPVEVFVATLGFSQYTYVEGHDSQQKNNLIQGTGNAFFYFGGVTKAVVPDNLKSAVTKADKYEAQINSDFLDFANHYGTQVLPARSNKPRDKALVEKSVDIVYTRVFAPLRNQIFYSLASLNKAIRELLDKHNNQPFQLRPESRRELFEEQEKHLLKPLPPEGFELKNYKNVTVMKTGYVQIFEDKHYYSVPYRFIGRKVKLIYTATQVSVFYNQERIAYHPRAIKKYGYTTTREHLSSTHQFVSEWNPEKFTSWAGAIAPVVRQYITRVLDSSTYPEQAYRSCVGILSYEKKVGRERFIKAVERASFYGAYNYTIIRKILQNGLEQLLPVEETGAQQSLPVHDNIRGPESYQ